MLDGNILVGVLIDTIFADAKMQVVTGRNAGRTAIANELTLADLLACSDHEVAHVHINGFIAIAMVDLHIVPLRDA